jgi:hypothetical protein
MTILTVREVRRTPRPANETRRAGDLTPEEAVNVRTALRFLRTRLGGSVKLAAELKTTYATVTRMCARGGVPSAGLAIRAARLAGVSAESVLLGEFPGNRCPHCGRGASAEHQ